jgi:hypothetical protein
MDDWVKMEELQKIVPHTRQNISLICKQGRIARIKVHGVYFYHKADVKRWVLSRLADIQSLEIWKTTQYKTFEAWMKAIDKW